MQHRAGQVKYRPQGAGFTLRQTVQRGRRPVRAPLRQGLGFTHRKTRLLLKLAQGIHDAAVTKGID